MPSTPSPAELRAWAREQGFPVAERGRLSADVLEAWKQAKGTGRSKAPTGGARAAERAATRAPRREPPAPPKQAPVDDDRLAALQAEVRSLRARVEALEADSARPMTDKRRLFARRT